MRTRSWLTFALALSLGAATARADRAKEAADFFRAAHAAYERKDFSAAARAFDAAYAIAPRAEVAYNAARAWQEAGNSPRAADDFTRALAAGTLDAASSEDARARLADLEQKTATFRIESEPGALLTVAHATDAPAPLAIHLEPGEYDVTARAADGRNATLHVTATAGATSAKTVTLPPKPAAPPPTRPPPPKGGWMRPTGFVGIGLGVVAAGAGAALGVLTLNERQAFLDSGDTSVTSHDNAVLYRTLTNVAWVVCGVAAAAGIVLVVAAPSSPKGSAALVVGPGVLSGSF